MKKKGNKSSFYDTDEQEGMNSTSRSQRNAGNMNRSTASTGTGGAKTGGTGVGTSRYQSKSSAGNGNFKGHSTSGHSNSATGYASTSNFSSNYSHPLDNPRADPLPQTSIHEPPAYEGSTYLRGDNEHTYASAAAAPPPPPRSAHTVNLFGYFCLIPRGMIGFNVYHGNILQYRLDMSSTDPPHLYSTQLTVFDDDTLYGRFCFSLDGIDWKEENVNNIRNYLYYQDKTQFRSWKCDGVNLNLAAVIYDHFTFSKHSPNWENPNCSKTDQDLGWNKLLSYIGSCFVQFGINDYVPNLRSFTFGYPVQFYVGFDSTTLLNALINKSPLELDVSSGELFMKWVMLLGFIKRAFTSSIEIEKRILPLLDRINPIDVCQLMKAGKYSIVTEHLDIIREICSKIVELQQPECIPWALLRLTLSKSAPADKLLRLYPTLMFPYIESFLPYIPSDIVPLGLLPNLRVYQSILENNKSIKPDIHTVKKIIENSDYFSKLQSAGAAEGLAELNAMYSFARTNPPLLKEFLDHALFQANSFATADLNTSNFIEVTLLQFAKLHPLRHSLISRCASVSSCLALRSDDDDFAESIYESLHQLLNSTLPEKELLIKTIHSSLPSVEGKGLRLRLQCYLKDSRNGRLVDMEKKAFDEIFNNPTSDIFKMRSLVLWRTLAKRDGLLSETNPYWTRLAYLLGLLWNKSLEQSIDASGLSIAESEGISSLFPMKDSDNYTFLLLSSDRVRELHDIISVELSEFPHLTQEPTYQVIYQKYSATCSNINAFASRLKERAVLVSTFEIILRHDWIMKNLPTLSNFILSKDMIVDSQRHIGKIREEWANMLVTFREFMSIHPRFTQCSLTFVSDIQSKVDAMQCEEIRHWKRPSFGGADMEERSKNLNMAQGSFIYRNEFTRQIEEEKETPVSSDPAAALNQWKDSIDKSFQSWASVISRVVDGSFPSIELKTTIQTVIDGIPECPEIPNNEVRARDTVSRHAVQVQEYLKNVVNQETKLSSSLMKSLKKPFEVNDFSEPLLKFLSAMEFSFLGKGLQELFSLLNYHCDPNDPLIQLIEEVNSPSNNTVATLSTLYVRTKTLYPEVFQIVQEFPSDLAVLVREDFLSLLNEIIDMRSLNQTVERLQNQVEPELLNELYVLRNVYNALAFDVEGFTALKLKNPRDLRSACSYFATVGWCLSEMKTLIGAVRTLADLYSGGVSKTSTVALVHALVSNGEYLITLPGSILTAVIKLKGEDKVLNPVELGDIPFQLCLHGSVTSFEDSVDTSSQRNFLKTMELLTQLREALSKLSIAGHPNFQESILKISGSISSAELEELVSRYQNIDSDWQTFLSENADINLPLLTCISRKQLVESLKILTHVDSAEAISAFVLILRSVYPLMSAEQADLHVRSVILNKPVAGAKQLFKQVHDLLKRGSAHLFPSPIQKTAMLLAVCQRFHPLVPTKLNPPSGVSLMKLRPEDKDKHCELCCSLFIQLYSRLPTSLEVLQCTQDTSEQLVIDFLRRWAASQHFQNFFPREERNFLFCVLNVESLKPNIQNAVLAKINFFRKSVTSPLVIFASSDPRQESLLCLGLRKDWVIESNEQLTSLVTVCQLVCAQFFKLKFPQIYFVTSPFPQSGKSSLILEDFVARGDNEDSLLYCRIPLTEDLDQVTQLLVSVGSDREKLRELHPEANTNAVLHFNVSSIFDIQQLNLFIMSYIVTGVCMNSNGSFCIRNPHDIIAIEWPSEGVLADRALKRSGLCSSFQPKSPKNLVHLKSPEYIPCFPSDDCILFRLQMQSDISLELGVKMAVAFFRINKSDSNNLLMPFPDDIFAMEIPDSVLLFDIFSQRISEELGKNTSLSPGLIYRFVRFFSNQLFGLFYFPCFQNSPGVESDLGRLYRRLAYYLALTSFKLAIKLAASAVLPLTSDVDDDDRLSNLIFSFEDWSKSPFLIFNVKVDEDKKPYESDYTMVSVTSENFLSSITSTDKNRDFIQFIEHNVRGQADNLLQNVCAGLNDENYHPSTDPRRDHPLKTLLPIVNAKPNFGLVIFSALDYLRRDRTIAPNAPITILHEHYSTALIQLRSITGYAQLDDTKTVSDFKRAAQKWFESITGSYAAEQAPFVLTIDNLIRILAMKLRLACKIPVVFMGETGCGKTHVVQFFARVSGCRMVVINVHGGMNAADLLREIARVIDTYDSDQEVIVLLDEINSTPHVWAIKELVCEGFILGRRIPKNLRFICIMNPRRVRQISQNISGLDFSPYQTNSGQELDRSEKMVLVYEVHRVPESVMSLVWDFGSPADHYSSREDALTLCHARTPYFSQWSGMSGEIVFTENLVHWMISAKLSQFHSGIQLKDGQSTGLQEDFKKCGGNTGLQHYQYLRSLLCALLFESQQFLRTEAHVDRSAASLRDIARSISLIPFIMQVQQRMVECHLMNQPEMEKYLYFKFLHVSVCTSLILNYVLRLETSLRQLYYERIMSVWIAVRNEHVDCISPDFLPAPLNSRDIYQVFDNFAQHFCELLNCDSGFAINEALKENVISLFCSILGEADGGTAQFIVGRPGSTKSSSLDILCASTSPNRDLNRITFFSGFPRISKFVLQCTPDTTAMDIERVALLAANAQLKEGSSVRCVIVLEEVGVTVGSIHNPLMVLHGLVDRGIQVGDGRYVRVPIVGISNWRLDASKMNRMRTTHRGNPTAHDLVETAKCIMQATGTTAVPVSSLQAFAQTFSEYILANDGSDNEFSSLSRFYGMRDFYAFIQFLQFHHSYPLAKMELGQNLGFGTRHLSPHLVRWATKINFGGHPNKELEDQLAKAILDCFFSDQEAQNASWQSVSTDEENSMRDVCDTCALISHYTFVKTSRPAVTEASGRRDLFHKHFCRSRNMISSCAELDSVNSFPTSNILAYCLNILSDKYSSLYRVRHVLLFTRAHAGLHLLFSLNIVQREEAVILFGRSDPTTRETLDDLIQIRRCMQNGGVLILVSAKHLYESLYDALNQHYSCEGEGTNRKYFTHLTMNGYTASFPIHQSFRCIAIEQESEATKLLPPFVNRFVKATLNYSTALTSQQGNLAARIHDVATITIDSYPVNLLKILIPGFTPDTLSSLSYLFPSESITKHTSFRESFETARNRLGFLISPRLLFHVQHGRFEGIRGDHDMIRDWENYAAQNGERTYIFEEDLALLDEFYPPDTPHLLLLTEDICLNFQRVCEVLSNALQAESACVEALDLHKVSTEKEIKSHLLPLLRASGPSFAIALFDANRISNHENLDQIIERFIHIVNNLNLGPDRHVVLIGIVQNSSIPRELPSLQFHLHFHPGWKYMFCDDIWNDSSITLSQLIDPEVSVMSEVLSVPLFCELVCSKALEIAQRVVTAASVDTLHDQLLQVFDLARINSPLYDDGYEFKEEKGEDMNEQGGGGDVVVEAILQLFLQQLLDLPELQMDWRRLALRNIRFAPSLRKHIIYFLEIVIERLFILNADALFAYGNFSHILPGSRTRDLFVCLSHSPLIVPKQDVSSCLQVNLPMSRVSKPNTSHHCSFPFSFVLIPLMTSIASSNDMENIAFTLESILSCHENYVLDSDEVNLYLLDAAAVVLKADSLTIDLCESLLSLLPILMDVDSDSVSIPAFHNFMSKSTKVFESTCRFLLNPTIHLEFLHDPEANFEDKLVMAASNDGSSLIAVDLIDDISAMCGMESRNYILSLYRAVAVAISFDSSDCENEACQFIQEVGDSANSLLYSFQTGHNFAMKYAKYLLPVVVECSPEDEITSHVIPSLLDCARVNSQALPRPASYFIFQLILDMWVLKPDLKPLLFKLGEVVADDGVDGELSVLLSRCIFDMCYSDYTQVRDIFEKILELDNIQIEGILLSGAVTGGLTLLCERILVAVSGDEVIGTIPDEDATEMKNLIELHISRNEDRLRSSTIFTLRALSSGSDMDIARTGIRNYGKELLPNCILDHSDLLDFIREAEETPSSLNIVPGYTLASRTLKNIMHLERTTPQQISSLQEADAVGTTLALLEMIFGSENLVGAKRQLIQDLIQYISSESLRNFAQLLVNDVQLMTTLRQLPTEIFKLWISTVISCLGQPLGVLHYFGRLINLPSELTINEDNRTLTDLVHGLFQTSCSLAYSLFHPQGMVNPEELERHRKHITDHILNIRCPSCQGVFVDFTGCFSVTHDSCHTCFCAWCFQIFPDAHSHVLTCPRSLTPGSYYGTFDQFMTVRRNFQAETLKAYLATLPKQTASAVLALCRRDIVLLHPPLPSLGDTVFTPLVGVQYLTSVINFIKRQLFPGSTGDDSAINWVHAITWMNFYSSNRPCHAENESRNILNSVLQEPRNPSDVLAQLREQCEKQIGLASRVAGIVAWNEEYETYVSTLSPEKLGKILPHHYALRTPLPTLDDFWEMIDLERNKYEVLHFLNSNSESLDPSVLYHAITFLSYIGDVYKCCLQKQMTREDARETSIGTLSQQYDHLGGERLLDFMDSMSELYSRVERFECKDKEYLDRAFGELQFDENLPLIFLLPRSEDEGIFANVVYAGRSESGGWQSLGSIQNVAVAVLEKYESPIRTATERPFGLLKSDLFTFSQARVDRFLRLYIDPRPIPSFCDDVLNLQWQLIHSSFVWGKPKIVGTLPAFPYSEDRRFTVLGQLAEFFGGNVPLPKDEILLKLNHIAKQQKASGVNDYILLLALLFLGPHPPKIPGTISDLSSLITIDLTLKQIEGKEILLKEAGNCHPAHLVAISAAIWDGVCHPANCVPLPEDLSQRVRHDLERILHDPQLNPLCKDLRMAMKLFGIQQMCTAQSEAYYQSTSLLIMRDMAIDIDPLELEMTSFPDIPVCHFQPVYELVEELFADVLTADTKVDLEDFEVSFNSLKLIADELPEDDLNPDRHPATKTNSNNPKQKAPTADQPGPTTAAQPTAADPDTQPATHRQSVVWENYGEELDLRELF